MDTRILIADDNNLYRKVLTIALERAGFVVVEETSTGREAVEATLRQEPDFLLLDISMPDMDGLAALPTIKFLQSKTKIILHSMLLDPKIESRARELGADAFIPKNMGIDQLIEILRAFRTGFTRGVNQEFLWRTPGHETPSLMPQNPGRINLTKKELTPQERQILSLLADANTNTAIAQRLFISKNTLKTHMSTIFKKIGVSNRTQAALWALRNGLDDDQEITQVA
jgi:two-component system NarL family response regulator